MLHSIHKQGYYISSCSLIDFWRRFCGENSPNLQHDISPSGCLGCNGNERCSQYQRIFMSEQIINIIVLNGFVSFFFILLLIYESTFV